MTITYEKTEDANKVKKIETNDSYIYLDVLQNEIDNLQLEIDDIPEPKTKPDQDTLDYWNDTRPPTEMDELEKELLGKKELLNQLNKVK